MRINRDTLGEDPIDWDGALIVNPVVITLDAVDWGTVRTGLLMAEVRSTEKKQRFLGREIARVNDLIRKQIDGELVL